MSDSARAVVEAAFKNPKANIICFARNFDESAHQQNEVLACVRSNPSRMASAQLSDGRIEFNNGSVICFGTQTRYRQDPYFFEGISFGCDQPRTDNIGAWFCFPAEDEAMLKHVKIRCVCRQAVVVMDGATG